MARTLTSDLTITEVIENLLAEFTVRIQKRDANAVEFGLDAYTFAKDIGNKPLIIRTCRALSQFYTDVKSEFHQSVKVLDMGINLLDEEESAEDKAELYRLLGLNYDYIGELIKSKMAYDESIRLLQGEGELTNKGKLTLARSQFNLSIIYSRLELPALADVCLRSAFEQYSLLDDKPGIARCYISFGVQIEETKGNLDEAYEHYLKAAAISAEIGDDVSLSVAKGNLAVRLAEKGLFDEALEAAFDALEKARRSANKRFQLNLYRQIGRCYHLKKDFENSEKWYSEGERMFTEMGISVDYYDLYGYWSDMLFDAGRFEEAFHKLKKASKQQAEMHAFHKSAAVNDAMLRFQLDEGKKEQEVLKRKNAEIEQYARKLEVSNFELKQFAHAASHDMKEPLRMISNYSQLLRKSINGNLTQEQAEYLDFLNGGARRMMSVLSNLVQWSNISLSTVKEKVDLNGIMEKVAEQPLCHGNDKKPVIKWNRLPVIESDPTALHTLFCHLIGNAVKFNVNQPPRVDVHYTAVENVHRFEISDNGLGIPAEYRDKVFIIFQRLHARDEFDGSGIGLTICKKLIDNLSGKIWIEDSPLGGTKFCFTLPR